MSLLNRLTRFVVLSALVLVAQTSRADVPFPAEFTLSKGAALQEGGSFHEFSERLFVPAAGATPKLQQGRLWTRKLVVTGMPESATSFEIRDRLVAGL